MNTQIENYLLAEQNFDLIHTYTLLQKEGEKFIDDCAQYFSADYNTSKEFLRLRALFNHTKNPRLRAALFIYLNRHGYNGLCRYNQSGIFNVPFGQYQKPSFPRQEMLNFHQHCQKAKFLHADFRVTFSHALPGDVIYCDPPYVALSRSANFSTYTQKKFNQVDQIELAALAKKSANQGIHVIISNHDTEFTREQYKDAVITSFPVRRMISCKSNQRNMVQELIAVFSP